MPVKSITVKFNDNSGTFTYNGSKQMQICKSGILLTSAPNEKIHNVGFGWLFFSVVACQLELLFWGLKCNLDNSAHCFGDYLKAFFSEKAEVVLNSNTG